MDAFRAISVFPLVGFALAQAPSAAQSAASGASAAPSAAGAAAPAQAAGGASGGGGGEDPAEVLNWMLVRGQVWAWIALFGGTMIYCAVLYAVAYMRTVACLNNDTQRYFMRPNSLHSLFRRHLVDAPLFRKRHHREFKLSSAINVGTLPSRAQMLFLVLYVGGSVLLTVWSIDFSQAMGALYSDLIDRTGTLAILNMIPLFLLAGRNNPLIKLTGITFDTYNLVHRWLGRIVVLEALLHALFYMLRTALRSGWAGVGKAIITGDRNLTGLIGAIAFTVILLQSPSAVRHAFYETFLVGHQLLAGLALGAVWVHLKNDSQHLMIIKAVLAICVTERGMRLIRILVRNVGKGGTTAEVEALPGEAVRVTVKMARPWRFRTGAHAYLYMPGIGWWTSHPFSTSWSDESTPSAVMSNRISILVDPEKGFDMGGPMSSPAAAASDLELPRPGEQTISFIIRSRTGFTEKLYRKAESSPYSRFSTTCFLEGPYGHQTLHSYGTVLLFAAGVGITHQVPHVRDLVAGYASGTVAARKVVLVWVIQKPEHLEWIHPWMTKVLGMPRRKEVLKIMLFVTKPKNAKEFKSPSSSVQMFHGRPHIDKLVDREVADAVGAVGVSVCGTGAMADDVRKACRTWMGRVNIDFSEESFSW